MIHGIVLDSSRQPVSNFQVELEPLGVDLSYMLPTAVTNAEGAYEFHSVCSGRYAVLPSDDRAGYPARSFFYLEHGAREPQVVLSTKHQVATLEVDLAPSPGVLLIRVRDRETGSDIRNAEIRMHIPGKPKSVLIGTYGDPKAGDPTYRVLIPANQDVQVRVICDGYAEWRDGKNRRKAIRLSSGDQLKLDVELHSRKR